MNEILCSTGALLGMPNKRDYKRLDEYAQKLECDGFEFMIYSSWYNVIDDLIESVKKLELNIPVIHCQKSLGEMLCGLEVSNSDGEYIEHELTFDEDVARFEEAKRLFDINIQVAREFGAKKLVLHLWNGLPSDKKLEKNIERFDVFNKKAEDAGLELMVENVVCNEHDPLSNFEFLHDKYSDISFVYDTKMAEFHNQTMKVFDEKYKWIFGENHVKHLHINDYAGGYMDWRNLRTLPIGKGHIDFETFFDNIKKMGYKGDYTVEATGFDRQTGEIDFDMLNNCFNKLRGLV